ncbi:STAS domain-containing protein [Jatrophihabitans fulvus]
MTFDVDDERVVVTMAGDIDYAVVDTVSDEDLAEYGASRPVVVHMGDVRFMDSLGLSLLLRVRNHADRGVTLVDVGADVRKLLDLTGLLDAFVLAEQTPDSSAQ